jgi:DNA primase
MAKLYEIFSGTELKIAEKIQQRRYQMLVHSYIYYEMNENLVSDSQWSKWAMELADLQKKYPDIASQVKYAEDFADWDGSSGAFLTYTNKPNIVMTANRLLQNNSPTKVVVPQPKKPLINKPSTPKKKLF